MNTVYAILILVLLVVLIYLNMVKNRASAELHTKMHPPRKEQEEFLKACELYLEYCKQPEEHPDAAADAKYDAAVYMKELGFLPTSLQDLVVRASGGPFFNKVLSQQERMRMDGEPVYMTYDAIRHIRQETFLECQKQDNLLSGYSQDKRFWPQNVFDKSAWKTYCGEMDIAFNQMLDRYLEELNDEGEMGPKIERAQ